MSPDVVNPTAARPHLVLASASPRRRNLLATIGIHPEIRPADLDETPFPSEEPGPYVERLARSKAEVVARPGEIVLAADTSVAVDGVILGKPEDDNDARRMLATLSGRTHDVMTGVALHQSDTGHTESLVVHTEVTFAELCRADIDWYLALGESMDKAGAYGLQGAGDALVELVSGSVSNVIGLPLAATLALANRAGVELRDL